MRTNFLLSKLGSDGFGYISETKLLDSSLHTATTASLTMFRSSTHTSMADSLGITDSRASDQRANSKPDRAVSFRVQDRWKTGGAAREVQLSKSFFWDDDEDWPSDEEPPVKRPTQSRWHTGTSKHEVLLPKAFR